jgi:hypothetical protein
MHSIISKSTDVITVITIFLTITGKPNNHHLRNHIHLPVALPD